MDSNTILRTTSILGLSSSLFVSGVSFSQSYLTIPLFIGLPQETTTPLFKDLYYSGAKLIVPLALTSTLSTAISKRGSCPTSSAWNFRPSSRVTVIASVSST